MFSPQFVAQCVQGTWITSMCICKSEVLPRYKRYSKLQDLMMFHIQKLFTTVKKEVWSAENANMTHDPLFEVEMPAAQPFSSNDLLKCVKNWMKITWKNQQKNLQPSESASWKLCWSQGLRHYFFVGCCKTLANLLMLSKLAKKKQSLTIQSSRQEHPHPIRHSANQHMLFAPFDFAPGCLAVGGLHTSARLDTSLSRSYLYQVNEWPKWRFLFIGRNFSSIFRGVLLMEEILHQLRLVVYPTIYRIPSINSMIAHERLMPVGGCVLGMHFTSWNENQRHVQHDWEVSPASPLEATGKSRKKQKKQI